MNKWLHFGPHRSGCDFYHARIAVGYIVLHQMSSRALSHSGYPQFFPSRSFSPGYGGRNGQKQLSQPFWPNIERKGTIPEVPLRRGSHCLAMFVNHTLMPNIFTELLTWHRRVAVVALWREQLLGGRDTMTAISVKVSWINFELKENVLNTVYQSANIIPNCKQCYAKHRKLGQWKSFSLS